MHWHRRILAKWPMAAWLPAVVVLALLAPGRSEADIIFSNTASTYKVPTNGGGTFTVTGGSPTVITNSGFSVGTTTLSYLSVLGDVGKSVTITYDIYESISYTAGSYETTLTVTPPTTVTAPAGTVTLSGYAEIANGAAFTVVPGSNAGATNSGIAPGTYNNPVGPYTADFSTASSSTPPTYLVLTESMTFNPTAANQIFSVQFAGDGGTSGNQGGVGIQAVTPEPATLAMAGLGGLAGMFTYFRRRKGKAIAAA